MCVVSSGAPFALFGLSLRGCACLSAKATDIQRVSTQDTIAAAACGCFASSVVLPNLMTVVHNRLSYNISLGSCHKGRGVDGLGDGASSDRHASCCMLWQQNLAGNTWRDSRSGVWNELVYSYQGMSGWILDNSSSVLALE